MLTTELAIPRTSGKGVSVEVGVRVTVEVGVAVYVGVWVIVGVVVMVAVAVEVGVEGIPIANTSFPASVGSIRAVLVMARIVPVCCKSSGRGFEMADIAQGKSANREQLSSRIPYLRKKKTSLEINLSCLKNCTPRSRRRWTLSYAGNFQETEHQAG